MHWYLDERDLIIRPSALPAMASRSSSRSLSAPSVSMETSHPSAKAIESPGEMIWRRRSRLEASGRSTRHLLLTRTTSKTTRRKAHPLLARALSFWNESIVPSGRTAQISASRIVLDTSSARASRRLSATSLPNVSVLSSAFREKMVTFAPSRSTCTIARMPSYLCSQSTAEAGSKVFAINSIASATPFPAGRASIG